MNITCPSCGRSVDHASPGCAEHASREAAEIHRAHVASGGSAEHCPVCTAPAGANRAERRQGMGAELDRLRATIERHEAAARVHAEERAAMHGEMARVRGLLDDVAHAHERDVLAVWAALGETHEPPQDVAAIIGRVEALRAAIEGRAVAPTNAEIDAHRGAFGEWLVWAPGDGAWVTDASTPEVVAIARECATRWWPLDRDGRPCAWPVVEVTP